MNRLLFYVILTGCVIVALIVTGFIYVDTSGHSGYEYDVNQDDMSFSRVKIDRYVTEDKLVYKEVSEARSSLGYPLTSSKLVLDKKSRNILTFKQESVGVKRQKRITLVIRGGNTADYLFLEHPRFFYEDDLAFEENDSIMLPGDILSYMSIVEKYNFWRKGVQSFDVLIFTEEPAPPLRDKIWIKYEGDEYVPVMGRKVETEVYSLRSDLVPETLFYLSRYSHRVVVLDVPSKKFRAELKKVIEDPWKRVRPLIRKVSYTIDWIKIFYKIQQPEVQTVGDEPRKKGNETFEADVIPGENTEAVFFESGNALISGRIMFPAGEGPFPAILIIPEDGPRRLGEELFAEAFGRLFVDNGFAVMTCDYPGQGRSQGDFLSLDQVSIMSDAVIALKDHDRIERTAVSIMGHLGGGYLALKVAESEVDVRACILMGFPEGPEPRSKERLSHIITAKGFNPPEDDVLEDILEITEDHLNEVSGGMDEFSIFRGIRLPVKEYGKYLSRKPYETIIISKVPFLFVLGRDDRYFDAKLIEGLKSSLKVAPDDKVFVFRKLGRYLGEFTPGEHGPVFLLNSDAESLTVKWLKKNAMPVEEAVKVKEKSVEEAPMPRLL